MKRVAAKFIPKLLKRVITSDESWVYGYDIETKAQSCQWKSPEEPRLKNKKSLTELKFIPKSVYQHYFEFWKKNACFISESDYFEGDKI